MERQFRVWVKAVCAHDSGLVSIDGKTICGAKTGGKSLFHMVSAFCHANGVCLAQVRVDEKSNKITAIPELIRVLDLEGCLVSIDAMGCQQAKKISPSTVSKDFSRSIRAKFSHGLAAVDTPKSSMNDRTIFGVRLYFSARDTKPGTRSGIGVMTIKQTTEYHIQFVFYQKKHYSVQYSKNTPYISFIVFF
jgi:predicted transposase YbfD/YdcC